MHCLAQLLSCSDSPKGDFILSPCVCLSRIDPRRAGANQCPGPKPRPRLMEFACQTDTHGILAVNSERETETERVRNCLLVFLMCDRIPCRQASFGGSGGSSTFPFVFRLG